jgi:hypothetical protein
VFGTGSPVARTGVSARSRYTRLAGVNVCVNDSSL